MKFGLKEFVRAAAIRALRTFAEGMLGVVGTTAVGITQVDELAREVGVDLAAKALCVSSLDRCDAIRTCYGLHADDAFAKPDSLDGQRLGAAERLLVSVIHELSLRPAD